MGQCQKVHRVIKFNQKSWLKPYTNMNTDLRQVAKNDFKKDLFKLMNNTIFGKTMENFQTHRDIKLVTTEKRKNYLVSKLNYHTTVSHRKLIGCKNKKTLKNP